MPGYSRPQRRVARALLPYPAKQAVHNRDALEPKLSHGKNTAKKLVMMYGGRYENVYILGRLGLLKPIFTVRVTNWPLPFC